LTLPRLVFSERDERQRWIAASDLELLEGLRGDSERALDELVRRKTPALVQVAFRVLGDLEEARDVVQVSFLRMWEHRARFDARWSPNTWIYRIVTNLSIDHLRSRKSRERHQEPYRHHLRQVESERGFSELQQRVFALAMEVLGPDILTWDAEGSPARVTPRQSSAPSWVSHYLVAFSSTIAAGSKDIQRNIIGDRILGLPR